MLFEEFQDGAVSHQGQGGLVDWPDSYYVFNFTWYEFLGREKNWQHAEN